MPLYEYICDSCSKEFTALVGVVSKSSQPTCPTCGCIDLERVMSRFSYPRSTGQTIDSVPDASELDDDVSIKRLMHEMKDELGGDFGNDIDSLIEEAESEDAVEQMV